MKQKRFYVMYNDTRTDRETTYSGGGVMKSFESADAAYKYLDECNESASAGRTYYIERI